VHVKKTFFALGIIFILIIFIQILHSSNIKIIPKQFNLNNINLYQEQKYFIHEDNWSLTIEKLNLKNIPIKDSISSDILENYIGHFPTSSFFTGNVCLAAHNSGYKFNYFQGASLLENGDIIEYNYYNKIKKYKVIRKYVINENDFSILNLDNKDKLTLVTCISNSHHQRLCIESVCEE